MSLAFWISLVVCVGSLLEAVIDHSETLEEFRHATTKRKKRWYGFKLGVYWFVFAIASLSTLITGRESIATDKTSQEQARAITNLRSNAETASNIIAVLTTNLSTATNRLAELGLAVRDRRLTDEQKKIMLKHLTVSPGETIAVEYPNLDREASAYARDFVSTFRSAGYNVKDESSNFIIGGPASGVTIFFNPSPPKCLPYIFKAFREANIKAVATPTTNVLICAKIFVARKP
jgi:hypothetical protein